MTAALWKPPDQLTVTYSGLGKFTQCRRMWHLAEYRGLRRKDEEARTGPLPFGGRIHTALELWVKGKIEQPVDIWNTLMNAEYVWAESQGFITEKLDKEAKLGHVMLTGIPDWLEQEGFWATYEGVSAETALTDHLTVVVVLNGVEVPVKVLIRGKADMILRRKVDDAYWILDWKTTAALAESVLTVLAKSPQTRIYALLAKLANPELKFYGGVIVFLRKVMQTASAKPPFYAQMEIPISKTDMMAYRRRLRAAVQDMAGVYVALQHGVDPDDVAYFTPSRPNCMSCQFRQPCDLMSSYPAGAVDMLKDMYVHHDPFERYTAMGGKEGDDDAG
jgi:hypothetical protein